jgi:hypothetical protein
MRNTTKSGSPHHASPQDSKSSKHVNSSTRAANTRGPPKTPAAAAATRRPASLPFLSHMLSCFVRFTKRRQLARQVAHTVLCICMQMPFAFRCRCDAQPIEELRPLLRSATHWLLREHNNNHKAPEESTPLSVAGCPCPAAKGPKP